MVQLQLGVASKAVPFTTTFIEYVPFSPDADGAENATVPCADLLQRLAAFPGIFVQSALPIDVRDWEQRLEDLKEQLERETEHKIKAAVLHIDVARASDLHYTPGQQVRVKQVDIKQGQILVDLGSGLAWVNARDVSITQAGTQPVSAVGWGGRVSKSATFILEPPNVRTLAACGRKSSSITRRFATM